MPERGYPSGPAPDKLPPPPLSWQEVQDRWNLAIQPGSKVAYQRPDGTIWTETVTEVTYRSGDPAVWPVLPWWRRIARRFTPARWRRPLQPVRPAGLPTVSFRTGPADPDMIARHERAVANLAQAGDVLNGLIRTERGDDHA